MKKIYLSSSNSDRSTITNKIKSCCHWPKYIRAVLTAFFVLTIFSSGYSQCTGNEYGFGTVATDGSVTTMDGSFGACHFAGEFALVTITADGEYQFASTVSSDFLTLTDDSDAVITFGTTPVTANLTAGTYNLVVNLSDACDTESSCRNLSGQLLLDQDVDDDSDGFTIAEGDCNDNDPAINPGATEIPDNDVDENCDGVVEFNAPPNDLCNAATPISCGDTLSGFNVGATDGDGVAADGCGTSSDAVGVWYAFMGNGDAVTASVCNAADFDTEITVYTGVCGDLTCLGNNDDNFGAGCSGNTSEFEFNSEVGTTYYIYVSGFGAATGTFDLSLTCVTIVDSDGDGFSVADGDCDDNDSAINPDAEDIPGNGIDEDCDGADAVAAPGNDLCSGATPIACGDTLSGTNVGATDGDGVAADGCGTSSNAVGVWYAFMGNGDAVTASVCNAADFDTEITVYTGVCGDLTCLGNNDDNSGAGCSGNTSEFEFDSEAGTTYYIYVSGFGAATGTFDLSLTCVTVVDSDGDGFSVEDGDCDDNDSAINPDAEDIPNDGIDQDCDGSDAIDADGDGFLVEDDCDDTNADINPDAEDIPGNGIDEDCDGADAIAAPDNDECGSATMLTVGTVYEDNPVMGNLAGATDSMVGDFSCSSGAWDAGEGDVFFSFMATASNVVIETRTVDGSTMTDSTIALYTDCPATTEIGCNDDGQVTEFGTFMSLLEITDLTVGATYYVRVVEYGGDALDTFMISVYSPEDIDGDGFSVADGDCDDNDSAINPDAEDIPNDGIDQDCDGSDAIDADGDGFLVEDDCDDTNADINPDAEDIPGNGIDEDCDGADAIAAPDNDECGSATMLTVGTVYEDNPVMGNLAGATDSMVGDFSCSSGAWDAGEGDVFFSFMATASNVVIETRTLDGSTMTDSTIALYTDCPATTEIGCNDDGQVTEFGTFMSLLEITDLTVGATYYVRVVEYGGDALDTFMISVYSPEDIDGDGFSVADGDCDDNDSAINPDAEDIPNDGIDQDCDGSDAIDADGDGFLVEDDCDDTNADINPDAEDIPGNGIDEDCDGADAIAAPDNDDCANATVIACGETINATSVGSTGDQEGSGCFMGSNGIWFTFIGTGADMTVSVDASFDHEVAISTGVCGDLTNINCDDQSLGTETHTFESVIDATYYVYVAHYSSSSTTTGTIDITLECAEVPECAAPTDFGPETETPTVTTFTWLPGGSESSWEFALSQPDATEPEPATVVTEPTANVGHAPGQTLLIWVRAICGDGIYSEWVTIEYTSPLEAPDNDDCANAEPIACGDTVMGSTANATDSGNNTSPDVFYVLSGTVAGEEITASLCGSSFDTYIRIFDACDGTQVAFNDDNFSACNSNNSQVTFTSDGATDYYIMVEGYSSNSGDYTLAITCETPEPAPDNDDCVNAEPISCGDTVMDSTANATDSGGSSGPDVFYTLAGSANGEEVTVSLCGSSFDTVLTVFDACDGNVVASNDDSCGLQSELTFTSDGTTNYIIRVDGFSSSALGDYTLSVTCETPDPCAGPLPQLTWTGTMDTNWENTGNWDNNEAPGLMVFADVTIPMGAPNYPMLTVGQDLYISECSTVTVESGASLNVNPNVEVTNDGIVANDGSVIFESDATGSAYIGSGMGMFMGDFTVERYIPAKRAYRQLGTPVTTSTPISDNWQQDTHITGPAGNTDGFDVTFTGNPSAYIFDNVGYEYVELANTNATNLIPGTMYHILIRGDRNTDLGDNNATPSETTLHATGELTAENVGSQMIAVNVPEQRFIAVGNPFQSQIDMNTVLTTGSTNINPNFYWVWDPTLGTRGAYTAIMAATGTASTAGSDANQYLQAGQAGWVYTAGAGQSSVIFDQASKNNSGFETSTFTDNGGSTSLSQLRLSLYESSAFANNDTATDGVLILFGANGNNGIDANDALSITNLDENFATSNNGELLSIENRAMPQETEEIQLEINTYRSTNYTIVAEGISIEGVTPYLYDNYTGTYTEIPQTGSVNYSYSVDAGITSSIANDRFTVVFFQSTLSTGSFDLDSVKLYPNPTNIGKFYLNVPLGMDDLEITIYNVLGTKLYNETGFNAGSTITVEAGSEFSMGTYFVELSSKGRTTTKKLIIN